MPRQRQTLNLCSKMREGWGNCGPGSLTSFSGLQVRIQKGQHRVEMGHMENFTNAKSILEIFFKCLQKCLYISISDLNK